MSADPIAVLRGAVACAVLAPSTHNSQPWAFRRVGHRLELRLDPTRHLDVIDPMRRQLIISCGCALYNARVAIRASGFLPRVELSPDPNEPELLARLSLGLPRSATDDDRALCGAIGRRHTNRRPFLDLPVGTALADDLSRAARAERTRAIRLLPAGKRAIAELVAELDRRQFAEPAYREQLREWLVPRGRLRKDGIPFVEKEYGAAGWFSVNRTLADPQLGAQAGDVEQERILTAPLVMVLATEGDDDVDWIDCGQALEALLLRATLVGLSAAFVDQLLEFEDLHAAVVALIGEGRPQMVMRLGYAPPLERVAPRRDLADVFTEID